MWRKPVGEGANRVTTVAAFGSVLALKTVFSKDARPGMDARP
jgi:hypothetical protein